MNPFAANASTAMKISGLYRSLQYQLLVAMSIALQHYCIHPAHLCLSKNISKCFLTDDLHGWVMSLIHNTL